MLSFNKKQFLRNGDLEVSSDIWKYEMHFSIQL